MSLSAGSCSWNFCNWVYLNSHKHVPLIVLEFVVCLDAESVRDSHSVRVYCFWCNTDSIAAAWGCCTLLIWPLLCKPISRLPRAVLQWGCLLHLSSVTFNVCWSIAGISHLILAHFLQEWQLHQQLPDNHHLMCFILQVWPLVWWSHHTSLS